MDIQKYPIIIELKTNYRRCIVRVEMNEKK